MLSFLDGIGPYEGYSPQVSEDSDL